MVYRTQPVTHQWYWRRGPPGRRFRLPRAPHRPGVQCAPQAARASRLELPRGRAARWVPTQRATARRRQGQMVSLVLHTLAAGWKRAAKAKQERIRMCAYRCAAQDRKKSSTGKQMTVQLVGGAARCQLRRGSPVAVRGCEGRPAGAAQRAVAPWPPPLRPPAAPPPSRPPPASTASRHVPCQQAAGRLPWGWGPWRATMPAGMQARNDVAYRYVSTSGQLMYTEGVAVDAITGGKLTHAHFGDGRCCMGHCAAT